MRKASTKDILRTVWKEKKRFISIMMITVLGVTLMTGLKAGCLDLKLSADRFYDTQRLFDISIMSTLGLTEEDVLVIQRMEGVEKAEGTFSEIVHTKKGEVNKTAEVKMIHKNGLNLPYVTKGRLPENATEIAVSETYLKETGKSLGDSLLIEEIMDEETTENEGNDTGEAPEENESIDTEEDLEKQNGSDKQNTDMTDSEDEEDEISIDVDGEVELEEEEIPNFPNTEFTIVGTVIDVMDINNAEGSAAFRATPNADYTFFVTEDAVESEVYTAVYLTLEGTRELLCYTPEYETEVENVTHWIETQIMEQRELARYQQITGEAYDKIAEKEEEMYDAFEEIEAEFSDAEAEIADARKELEDGWKELEDGRRELEDGQKELEEGRQELVDGRKELDDGWKELEEGIRELQDGRRELEDGKQQLIDAEKEFEEEIADAKKELDDGYKKLTDGWEQLNEAEKQLNSGQEKLTEGKEELKAKEKEAKKQLERAEKELNSKIKDNEKQKKELNSALSDVKMMFGEDGWEVKESLTIQLSDYIPPEYLPPEHTSPKSINISLKEAWNQYIAETGNIVSPILAKELMAKKPKSEAQIQNEIQTAIEEASQEVIREDGNYGYGFTVLVLRETIAKKILGLKAGVIKDSLSAASPGLDLENVDDVTLVTDYGETVIGNLQTKKTQLEEDLEGLLAIENPDSSMLELIQEARAALVQISGALTILEWDMPKANPQKDAGDDTKGLMELASGIAITDATKQVLNGAKKEFEKQKESALSQIEDGWKEIYKGEQELEEGRKQLEEGRREVSENYRKWQDGVKELEENELKARQEIADKWEEIAEGEQELADGEKELLDGHKELLEGEQEFLDGQKELREGEQELLDGEKELRDGEKELRDGEVELADGEEELAKHKQEYLEERAKAEDKIAEAKQKVADIDMTKWYVQDRTSLSGYANVDSDTSCIESLATVFTIVFFIVAILISLTTVTRMVEEERGLIGTYKALGFTDGEIRAKYVVYALGASILGWILGDVGGFVILPEILFVFFRVMYLIPEYMLTFEAVSGTLSGMFFIAGIVGAAVMACYSELKHVPAHLMRPKAPKEGSRVFLEYITPLWKRMSFLNKVTARNLFRYKKRMFMTLFGIMGCTALLVFGLAIKDSVSELMPLQYEQVYSYDLLAVAAGEDNEKLISYMEESKDVEKYLNVQIESVKLKNENRDSEKVQLIIFPKGVDISDYFTLKDDEEEPIVIGNKGIYLTENASKILDLKVGDMAHIQKVDLNQEAVVVTELVKNYLGNSIYMSQEAYEEVFGKYEPNGIIANLSDSCQDQIGYSDKLAKEDWILSSVSTQELKETFSQAFTLINLVVYVVLVLAACLAFVVLFTLASINISERERELATIKVLGFHDKEVHAYVNKETLILTAMGILIGLPVGAALSSMLTDILNMPSIYFAVTIYGRSYWIAAGIALVFAFIVQFLTDRSLDVIDPVEALKSVE